MRYSLEPTYRRYVKGYGPAKIICKNAAKKYGDKYGKNLMDTTRNKELTLLKQLVKK